MVSLGCVLVVWGGGCKVCTHLSGNLDNRTKDTRACIPGDQRLTCGIWRLDLLSLPGHDIRSSDDVDIFGNRTGYNEYVLWREILDD